MLQNATSLRTSAPWPRNISDEQVSCTALPRETSLQILFKCPTPDNVFEVLQNPHILLNFGKVPNSLRPRKTTS